MNCESFALNIDAYIDGMLDSGVRGEMEKHAEVCPSCREMLEAAKMLCEMCEELAEVDVPLPAQAAWRKAVRNEAKKSRNPMAGWSRGIATVAAAMVVLVMGTYSVRTGETAPVSSAPVITIAPAGEYDAFTMMPEQRSDRPTGVAPVSGYVTTGLQSDGSAGSVSRMIGSDAAQQVETVVVRSAARSIESEKYDADMQWLNDLVSEYDAWFEERSETAAPGDGVTGRTASAAVRVPSDRLDDFLMELDQLGKTVARSEAAEDITGRYMDTQSRLDAMLLQKEKLDEMMAAAASVQELIAIDDKLTEVIGSIESLEGDLRRWESQKSYSRVELTLSEKLKKAAEPAVSLGERMKRGFEESVEWLKAFGQDALVMLACAAPRLVIWIPAAVLAAALVCIIRAKRRK